MKFIFYWSFIITTFFSYHEAFSIDIEVLKKETSNEQCNKRSERIRVELKKLFEASQRVVSEVLDNGSLSKQDRNEIEKRTRIATKTYNFKLRPFHGDEKGYSREMKKANPRFDFSRKRNVALLEERGVFKQMIKNAKEKGFSANQTFYQSLMVQKNYIQVENLSIDVQTEFDPNHLTIETSFDISGHLIKFSVDEIEMVVAILLPAGCLEEANKRIVEKLKALGWPEQAIIDYRINWINELNKQFNQALHRLDELTSQEKVEASSDKDVSH